MVEEAGKKIPDEGQESADIYAPQKKKDASPPSPRKIILIVDDKGSIRNIIKHDLEQSGYNTLEAADGLTAIEKALKEKIDLILLDVMMPKVDGLTVCKRLRQEERTKTMPIVLCTAKGQKEDIVSAMKVGADDYIIKPFTKAILLAKLEKFLGPNKAAEGNVPLSEDKPPTPSKPSTE